MRWTSGCPGVASMLTRAQLDDVRWPTVPFAPEDTGSAHPVAPVPDRVEKGPPPSGGGPSSRDKSYSIHLRLKAHVGKKMYTLCRPPAKSPGRKTAYPVPPSEST